MDVESIYRIDENGNPTNALRISWISILINQFQVELFRNKI